MQQGSKDSNLSRGSKEKLLRTCNVNQNFVFGVSWPSSYTFASFSVRYMHARSRRSPPTDGDEWRARERELILGAAAASDDDDSREFARPHSGSTGRSTQLQVSN